MSLIKIKGKRELLEVSYNEAYYINNCWNGINNEEKRDPEDKFMACGMTLRYALLDYIDMSDRPKASSKASLSTEDEYKKFVADMIEYSKKSLQHIVSWYGKDEQEEAKYKNGHIRPYKQYRVYNPIIGMTDARVVQYCLDKNILSDKNVSEDNRLIGWAVYPDRSYEKFMELYDKMMFAKYSKETAQKKEIEMGELITGMIA